MAEVPDWFADFAIAVKPFMEQCVTAYRIVKKEQIDLGTLSYRTLANDFREEVRSTPSNAKEYGEQLRKERLVLPLPRITAVALRGTPHATRNAGLWKEKGRQT